MWQGPVCFRRYQSGGNGNVTVLIDLNRTSNPYSQVAIRCDSAWACALGSSDSNLVALNDGNMYFTAERAGSINIGCSN